MESGAWDSEDLFWSALRFCQSLRKLCLSEFFRPEAFFSTLISNPSLRELHISYMDGLDFLDPSPELESLESLQIVDCVDIATEAVCNLSSKAPRLLSLSLSVFFLPNGDLTPLRELNFLQEFHFGSTGLTPGSLAQLVRGMNSKRLWPSLTHLSLSEVADEDVEFAIYFAPQLRELCLSASFGTESLPLILSKMGEIQTIEFTKLEDLTNEHLDAIPQQSRQSLTKLSLNSCIHLSSPACNAFLHSLSSLRDLAISGSPDVVLGEEFGQQAGPAVGQRYNAM